MLFYWLCSLLSIIATKGYDDKFKLNEGQRYVVFCGAAYCTDPYFKQNTVDSWTCHACKSYPNVKATSFHGSRSDANGFVGYDYDKNEILVSFAGTDPLSIQNWIDDLDFAHTSYPYCSNCTVHEGFYNAFTSVSAQVKSLVKTYQTNYPSATLSITGHSLGAAMAAHCAAEFVQNGIKFTTLYTFGMPRVGNNEFQKWYVSKVSGTFRIVHEKDPVPQLPPQNWGFHHMPYEVFYTRSYQNWQLCTFEGEDKSCSDQYLTNLDILQHLNYLDFDFVSNWISCEI